MSWGRPKAISNAQGPNPKFLSWKTPPTYVFDGSNFQMSPRPSQIAVIFWVQLKMVETSFGCWAANVKTLTMVEPSRRACQPLRRKSRTTHGGNIGLALWDRTAPIELHFLFSKFKTLWLTTSNLWLWCNLSHFNGKQLMHWSKLKSIS